MILFFYFCFDPLLLHNCLFRNWDFFSCFPTSFHHLLNSYSSFFGVWAYFKNIFRFYGIYFKIFTFYSVEIKMKSFTLLFTHNYSTILGIFHFHFHFILFYLHTSTPLTVPYYINVHMLHYNIQ